MNIVGKVGLWRGMFCQEMARRTAPALYFPDRTYPSTTCWLGASLLELARGGLVWRNSCVALFRWSGIDGSDLVREIR